MACATKSLRKCSMRQVLTKIRLSSVDLSKAEVKREWNNIDILASDPANRIVLLIENKISTGEHSDQLSRYYFLVESAFPGCRIVAVFLTPEGVSAIALRLHSLELR